MSDFDQRVQLPTSITNLPTSSDITQPQPQPEIKEESQTKIKSAFTLMLKSLLVLVCIVMALILGTYAYFKYYKQTYSDPYYGFIIKDQRGWYSILPKPKGVYYIVGTSKAMGEKIISTLSVEPLLHLQDESELKRTWIDESCVEAARKSQATPLKTSSAKVNNLHGFLCISEGRAQNTDRIYTYKQYILINENGNKYDYIVTTSQPKDNVAEEEKVVRILNNFYAK